MHNLKIYKNKILILMSIIVSCLVLCFTLTTKAYTYDQNTNKIEANWQEITLSNIKLKFKNYKIGTECEYNDGVYYPNQSLSDWDNPSGTDVYFNNEWIPVYTREDNKYYFDYRSFVANNSIDYTIYINGVGLTQLTFNYENETEYNNNYYYSFVSNYNNGLYRIYVPIIYNTSLDLYDVDIKYYGPLNVQGNNEFDIRLYNNYTYVPYVKFNIDNQFILRNNYRLNDSTCLYNNDGNIWFLKNQKSQSTYTKLSFDFEYTRFEEQYENNNVYAFSYNNFLPLSNYFNFYISEYINPFTLLDYVFYKESWIDYDLYTTLLQNYNELNQNYNDYQETHSYTNQQYNDLEFDYQTLDGDYSDLQNEYNNLEQRYNNLEFDYQTLDGDYSDLQSEYNKYMNETQYGIFNYIEYATIWYNDDGQGYRPVNKIKSQLINDGYIKLGGIFDGTAEQIVTAYSINYDLYFWQNTQNQYIPIEKMVFYITNNENYDVTLTFTDTNNNQITLTRTYNDSILNNYITPENIKSEYLKNNINNVTGIRKLSVVWNTYQTMATLVSGDNNNYNKGFADAQADLKDRYENTIKNLEEQVQTKYNEGYQTGYNTGANTQNSLYNMIIAIADTPISIFKQIFNFNILGLDISGFIFGIISLIIIIWLIKKII